MTRKIFILGRSLAVALVCFLGSTSIAGAQERYSIAVLMSAEISPYRRAMEGFEDELEDNGVRYRQQVHTLTGSSGNDRRLITDIIQANPNVIHAIGSDAAELAEGQIDTIPIVFSMVLDPVGRGIVDSMNRSRSNVTGVSLEISIETQFKKLLELIPGIREIGMLYDAKHQADTMVEAKATASKLGLELIAVPVNSPADITDALNKVLREADALWAVPDNLIYNSQTAKHILLSTLRRKKPFMAFSSNYVNSGALLALEADYYDIGRQAGWITYKILRGDDPGNIPIGLPRKVRTITNPHTARHIGVDIPRGFADE